jgi:hypothetical protein
MPERRRSRLAALALLALAAGCGAGRGGGRQVTPIAVGALEGTVSGLVQAALEADADFTEGDSLYAPWARVVRAGEEQLTYPRYAGIDSGGQVAITASQVVVGPALAWADVDYRWVDPDRNEVRPARGTFVIAPRDDGTGWWIVHAHSSTPAAQGGTE